MLFQIVAKIAHLGFINFLNKLFDISFAFEFLCWNFENKDLNP